MSAAEAHPTLVGVFDPAGALGAEEAQRTRAALAGGGVPEVVSERHLVAGRVGVPRRLGRRDTARPSWSLAMVVGADFSTPAGGPSLEERFASGFRSRGISLLDHAAGDFLVLVWDEEGRRGLLAQDQLGGRALYYTVEGGRLLFASDVVTLLRIMRVRPSPDMLTLGHKAANSEPPPERTVYEGVKRLCGGHALELGPDGWRRRRYWAPRYRTPDRLSATDVQARLWELVCASIQRRTADATDVGIVMSGGLDSTVVAAAAAECAPEGRPPRGYSAVFPGRPELDESERVDLLSGHLGLPSTQVAPRPTGVVASMLEYLDRWKVPLSGPGYVIEKPLLDRAARDGVQVVLDGQGGDEVFGLSPLLPADRIRRGRIVSSLRLARRFPSRVDSPPVRASLRLWKRFGLEHALPRRVHLTRGRERRKYWLSALRPEVAQAVEESHQEVAWDRYASVPLWWAFKSFHLVEGRERVGLTEYLRHRAAMRGMKARPPLLDLDLVRFALSYPPELDFDRYSRPNVRGALRGRVPEAVRLERRKSNLAPFYHECWVGSELPVARALLLDASSPTRALLRPGAAEELLRDPPAVGSRAWIAFSPKVWGLLSVECFLRHHEDPEFGRHLRERMIVSEPSAEPVSES